MRSVSSTRGVLLFFSFFLAAALFLSACAKSFTISVDSVPSDGFVHATKTIENVSLPIDSAEKACKVWLQYSSVYLCKAKDGAADPELQDGKEYWVFDNPVICDPKAPYPCGGGCSALMEKKTGNIKGLSCQMLG
jgi:hypothetical protein